MYMFEWTFLRYILEHDLDLEEHIVKLISREDLRENHSSFRNLGNPRRIQREIYSMSDKLHFHILSSTDAGEFTLWEKRVGGQRKILTIRTINSKKDFRLVQKLISHVLENVGEIMAIYRGDDESSFGDGGSKLTATGGLTIYTRSGWLAENLEHLLEMDLSEVFMVSGLKAET